ncbi:MAG: FAD-dependent oxidoreductase [Planctomycetia bacterium]|nr:FAD-dependent oxidoreductase [Planctomycetia bacterium]
MKRSLAYVWMSVCLTGFLHAAEITTEVCVVGGGSGGIGAAIAAGREGAETVLVEKFSTLGGTGGNGLVSNWEGGPGCEIAAELYERMRALGGAGVAPHCSSSMNIPNGFRMVDPNEPYELSLVRAMPPKGGYRSVPYLPEAMDRAAREMMAATGHVTILDDTEFIDAEADEHKTRVTAIRVRNRKTGEETTIRAQVFIDCTGSVFLCRKLGCETYLGQDPKSRFGEEGAPEEGSDRMNAVVLGYRIEPRENAKRAEILPGEETGYPKCAYVTGWRDGPRMVNMLTTFQGSEYQKMGYDETVRRGQRVVKNHWAMLQKFAEFQNYELVEIAPLLGIREDYRVKAKYMLRASDIFGGWDAQDHPDRIAVADHPADTHGVGGGLRHVATAYGVPYRCLIPDASYTNLLVACRGSGFSHIAASSCRLQRTMIQLGHAAGTAAAWAASGNGNVSQIDVPELVRRMNAYHRYPPFFHRMKPAAELPKTGVTFQTNDAFLQNLYDRAEEAEKELCCTYRENLPAVYEGANYAYFWLETQPMAGAMYAKRNLEAGRNLQWIFMETQREDGRIPAAVAPQSITKKRGWDQKNASMAPGQIYLPHLDVTAFFGQLQGYALPAAALDIYYLCGANDRVYLNRLYQVLEKYDAYLWNVRDSNGDGILELWCGFDNGEDRSVRNFDAPDYWPFDVPPTLEHLPERTPENVGRWWPCISILKRQGEAAHRPSLENIRVPYQSMDVMAWSHEGRRTLAEISRLLGNGREREWTQKADDVRKKVQESLWIPEKHACYDRDKNGEVMDILLHNNLRCMYYRLFTQEMADAFIRHHLLCPEEFWTPVPLVSIAANDPMFQNTKNNSWSGQPQGLTYQRAIRALENYGHFAEVSLLGEIFLKTVGQTCRFRQQFDPFTGVPDDVPGIQPNYGPTILAVLEYFSRMYGIHLTRDSVLWSALPKEGHAFTTTQQWGEKKYRLEVKEGEMVAHLNDRECFRCTEGVRVLTDFSGKPIALAGIAPTSQTFRLTVHGQTVEGVLPPNGCFLLDGRGNVVEKKQIPFDYPLTQK